MASELTDKIRTAYPHQYDDLSDSELEAKILAKHPEYKDLTTSKSTTNSGSESTSSDKPTNEPVVKASATASGASESEAKARGDSDSIPAKESRFNGNVIDSGSPNQDNIIKPEEHESLLSKGWKLLDNPLVHRIVTGDSPELSKMREELGIKGVQGPELMKIPGMNTLANTIREKGISSGEYSKGFAASILGDLIDAVSSGFDPRNAATKQSPMDLFPIDHLPENVPEGTPVFKGSSPTKASEQFPELLHGTNEANYNNIIKTGKFDPNFGKENHPEFGEINHNRQYDYSVGGPDTVYLTDRRDSWLNKDWADNSRAIRYDKEIKTELTPDAKIAKVNSLEELNKLAKQAGFNDAHDFANLISVDGLRDGVNPEEINKAREAIKQFKQNTGYDGINLAFDDGPNSVNIEKRINSQTGQEQFVAPQANPFGGRQIMVFDPTKVKPIIPNNLLKESLLNHNPDLVPVGEEPTINKEANKSAVNPEDRLLELAKQKQGMGLDNPDIVSPPTNVSPIFNGRGKVGETGIQQNKPRLLLNANGSFINKETGEMFDMRGHKIDPSEHKPGSLIDMTDQMNNKEITHEGGSDNQLPEPPDPNDPESKHKTTFSDIINLPKALKASFDLSAPGRQGLGLIHTKEWWTAWNGMFKGLQSDEAFKATQQTINNRPLFKSFGDEPSFAQKVGLKLTNLGKLDSREESFMSGIAEKFPGVKPSERAYTAYLNKLRADTFENLMSKYKVLGENGEYNIPLAKELANYINNATGRGSLGALESSAVALNNAFFSPRFFASRLKLLGEGGKSVFTPSTYVFSQPNIRREYLKSLLAIAGVGTTIGELAKLGGASVEHDPTNSDFMKIKVGNTRIDPYAGMQQPVVLASRLLSGKSTSSTSGKTTDLSNPKYGQSNRMDVIGRFARSKESPALSFVHGLLAGKDNAGKKFDVPEEVVNLFVPMVLQDLKSVATENPNLIPYLHEKGLGFSNTDVPRSMLAIPGVFGASVQNYSNSKSN